MNIRILLPTIISALFISSFPSSFAHDHQHHGKHSEMDKNRPAPLKDTSLYQLESQWTNQDGKKQTLAQFQGQPLVLTMAYTACKAACPILISDMKRIEQGLPDSIKGKVKFALLSFDSKKDTPEALKAYANSHGLDSNRWTLLTSNQDSVRQLAAALGMRYKQDASGDYSHSNIITILSSDGEIIHQQVGLRADPKQSIDMLTKVVSHK